MKDPDEREIKVKKFILGNVNFIGELINIQLLSKKIVFQCIDNLFKRFEKEEGDDKLRLINLEAIVILTDKFGTLINKQKTKIKPEDLKDFTSKVDNIMAKLDTVQKEANLPGYIKYKIINLIEKKKAGWEETQFEKNIIAKGKEEAVEKVKQESRRFAKRQLTWFRREKDVIWIDKDKYEYDESRILQFIEKTLIDKGVIS